MSNSLPPEHNPFKNQPEITEAAKEFSTEVLGYLDDHSEGSFMDTLYRISPFKVSLREIYLTSPALNPQVRSLLTKARLQDEGDDLCAELDYTRLASGDITLDQLGITLDDSANKVVLTRGDNNVVTVTDYSATGPDRRLAGPISLIEDTVLSTLFLEIPDDLGSEQWQKIVDHLENRAIVTERTFDIERVCDGKIIELRIIESELGDSSRRAIEIGVFSEQGGVRSGIRMHLTEFGTTAQITTNANNVVAMRPVVADGALHYATAFEAFSNGSISGLNPSVSDIAQLEIALEDIIFMLQEESRNK